MKGKILSVMLLFAIMAWAGTTTVVLQDGLNSYAGTEDAYISSSSSSSNYGTSADLIGKYEMCSS